MKINYRLLYFDEFEDWPVKVDYAKLATMPMPNRLGHKVNYDLLDVVIYPYKPNIFERLHEWLIKTGERFKNRIQDLRPRRIIWGLAPAAACLCLFVASGTSLQQIEQKAAQTPQALEISSVMLADVQKVLDSQSLTDFLTEQAGQRKADKKPEMVMTAMAAQLDVYMEPSESSDVAGTLYEDSSATVVDEQDGWTQIQSGNLTGWVSCDALLTGEDAEEKLNEVGRPVLTPDTGSLKVRSAPDVAADVIGDLAFGDTIDVTKDGDWIEVEFNGQPAYIEASAVNLTRLGSVGETTEEIALKDGTIEKLATIIYCEAGNQCYEGQIGVGNVVLNRIASPNFPDDLESVLRAPGQFTPVDTGFYDHMLYSGRVPESCFAAARDALAGENVVGEALYFQNPTIAGWHDGLVIEDHVFW